jgi:hypothetical protein
MLKYKFWCQSWDILGNTSVTESRNAQKNKYPNYREFRISDVLLYFMIHSMTGVRSSDYIYSIIRQTMARGPHMCLLNVTASRRQISY